MCGYGNRGTEDWKATLLSSCFLSLPGLKLNGGLLDINCELLKHGSQQQKAGLLSVNIKVTYVEFYIHLVCFYKTAPREEIQISLLLLLSYILHQDSSEHYCCAQDPRGSQQKRNKGGNWRKKPICCEL